MLCERDIKKLDPITCRGEFCQPDGFNAKRIAQNFSNDELDERILVIREKLEMKPKSCELQHAFNQLSLAIGITKGGLN